MFSAHQILQKELTFAHLDLFGADFSVANIKTLFFSKLNLDNFEGLILSTILN